MVAYLTIVTMDNPIDILKEFVGLIALVEVDNWAGTLFELYLETFYQDIIKAEDYCVFETCYEVRTASYYHIMTLLISYFVLFFCITVDRYSVICPNFDLIEDISKIEEEIVNLEHTEKPYLKFNQFLEVFLFIAIIIAILFPFLIMKPIKLILKKLDIG